MARGSKTVAEVAKELGVSPSMLHRWREHFESEIAGGTPPSQGEREEIERLRRELRDLQAENTLLKNDLPRRVACWTRNSRGGNVSPLWKSDGQLFGAA